MVSFLTDLADRAGSAAQSLLGRHRPDRRSRPLRLGVTGLARSGKTVFTTALVHHLVEGSALPAFRAAAEGRIRRARLAHQPDDDVPRFPYEEHVAALVSDRRWPQSTNADQRAARRHRLRARRGLALRSGDARPRHRRLSGRMAARPRPHRRELTATGRASTIEASRRPAGRRPCRRPGTRASPPSIRRARPTRSWRRARARPSRPISRRCGPGPEAVATTPPGPLPDAGRPRRLAGADLRAARRCRRSRDRAEDASRR